MIAVVSRRSTHKGRLFEAFSVYALGLLGYRDFRTNIRKTGREIDVRATAKVTGHRMICECKAYVRPLTADHLTKFRGLLETERDNDKFIAGTLIFLSGFNSALKEMHSEMPEETQRYLRLLSGDELLEMLAGNDSIIGRQEVQHSIAQKSTAILRSTLFLVTDFGRYWLLLLGDETKATHFTLLSERGSAASSTVYELVKCHYRPARDLSPLKFDVVEDVACALAEHTSADRSTLAAVAGADSVDIEMAVTDLCQRSLVREKGPQLVLADDSEAFATISRMLLLSKHRLSFFLSPYTKRMISETLLNYVNMRYRLKIDEEPARLILSLISYSPSALLKLLTRDPTPFLTGYRQIQASKLARDASEKWATTMTNVLAMDIAKSLVTDLDSHDMARILEDKGVRGYQTSIEFKSARIDGPDLSFRVVGHTVSSRARENIEAGQLVSGDLGAMTELGQIYVNLGELDMALEVYSTIAKNDKSQMAQAIAKNNMGLIWMQKGDLDRAAACYNEAIAANPKLPQPYYNLALVQRGLSDSEAAAISLRKAVQLNPDYQSAQDLLIELGGT